jgi:uncharacterized protein (TIGR02246 family)
VTTAAPVSRAVLAAALLALTPLAARAQVMPSYTDARAEYFSLVARAADRMARGLERAVASGQASDFAAVFAPDVTWTPSTGAPVRGLQAVTTAFVRARPRVLDFRIELAEFDASNRLAFVTGVLRYSVPTASGLTSAVSSPFAAALYQERETEWRIRLFTGGDLPPSLAVVQAPADSLVAGSTTPFAVELRDGAGAPLPRAVIRMDVLQGGGKVSPSDLVTDEQGRAATTFTLGPLAGPQVVRVLSGALPDEPLDVRVTARAGAPAAVSVEADTSRRVTAGAVWPSPLRLLVKDGFGNPVPSADVTLAASNGIVEPTKVRTDSSGRAEARLRTGGEPGELLVEAVVGGIRGELALRTRPGLTARIELPAQGIELAERSNRETGARTLDADGRPTDDPPLDLQVRDERIALVTDDARVVALAAGQTWLLARSGDVMDSTWITVRADAAPAVRANPRVVRLDSLGAGAVDLLWQPADDSVRVTAFTALLEWDAALTVTVAAATAAPPGLRVTPAPDGRSATITWSAAPPRRAGVAGPLPLVTVQIQPGTAADGRLRLAMTKVTGVRGAELGPVPPYVVPVLRTVREADRRSRVTVPLPASATP